MLEWDPSPFDFSYICVGDIFCTAEHFIEGVLTCNPKWYSQEIVTIHEMVAEKTAKNNIIHRLQRASCRNVL